jgi:hypothetical protein
MFHDMFSRYICSLVRTWTGIGHPVCHPICFTICLFISPDLDGHRAPKNRALTLRDPENCKVSKPKYEATALCSHRSIGYPNHLPMCCDTFLHLRKQNTKDQSDFCLCETVIIKKVNLKVGGVHGGWPGPCCVLANLVRL